MSSSDKNNNGRTPTIEVVNFLPSKHSDILFCYLIDAGRYVFEEQESMFRSKTGIYMVYLEGGGGTLAIRGKETSVKTGDLLLFRASEKHVCNLKGNLTWCHFDSKQARRLYSHLADEMGCVYCLTPQSPIPLAIQSIITDAKNDDAKEGKSSLAIYASLVMLHDKAMHLWPEEEDEDDPIRKAALYISNNCSEHFHIQDVAKKFSLNYEYFCRAFKDRVGRTPQKYMQDARFEKAKKLLLATTKNVSEIAFEVGYSSGEQFIKAFRKANGITPGNFRKASRKF